MHYGDLLRAIALLFYNSKFQWGFSRNITSLTLTCHCGGRNKSLPLSPAHPRWRVQQWLQITDVCINDTVIITQPVETKKSSLSKQRVGIDNHILAWSLNLKQTLENAKNQVGKSLKS